MSHLADQKRRAKLEDAFVELAWRRAARDPFYFVSLLQIPSQGVNADEGREPFRLFDYQADDLQAFLDHRFIIMLKCRQIGASTLIAAYVLWMALFRPGSVILWISNNQGNADKAIKMLNVMWGFLPAWVKERAPKLTADQAGLKEWTFGSGMTSRIRAYAGTATAGASETASLVVLDEFALIDGKIQDDLYRSASPTTDAGGKLFILSTARGGHNRFAKMFRRAHRGEGQYHAIFHPWMVSRFVNPKADVYATCPDGPCDECIDTTILETKKGEFEEQPWLIHAEYPGSPDEAFRESGNPRFADLPDLTECEHEWVRLSLLEGDDGLEPVVDDEGPLRVRADVWAQGPDSWRHHVIFGDPSEGIGGDYFAAQVLTYDDDQLPDRVAWWHSNTTEPADVARELDWIGRHFEGPKGPALLAIETTGGYGALPLHELQTSLMYPRLYSYRPTGHRKRKRKRELGFSMHAQRRPLVIDRLAKYVTTKDDGPLLGGIDPLLRYELGTFVRTENGRYQADTGCHDDLVMSTAGALWILLEDVDATLRPEGEREEEPDAPAGRTYSLAPVFEQIEQAEREVVKANRKAMRQFRRDVRREMVKMGRR